MQRRRSFDNTTQSINKENLSVSFQDEPYKKVDSSRCKQSIPVPFPRGGRQIGETHIPQNYTSSHKPLTRSNSSDPHRHEQGRKIYSLYKISYT